MTTLTIPGPHAAIAVHRDAYGIAHVFAEDEHDAWLGQGFVAAQDRLWQMEYDRRRATGRWAEVAGEAALAADRLARKLQLTRSAQADVAAMSPETRAMFEAYAAGVNAYVTDGHPLPPEFDAAGITPSSWEPWEPWHSCAAFKIRHVLMGVWQKKLIQAQLLVRIGPEAYARLDGRPPVGSAVILPPHGAYASAFETGAAELQRAAAQLGFLAASEGGSNSWALHGSRTTTGSPVLCNDSHRALDVPSVYWQVHLACPQFNAAGATFPGLPGFPHFGHNEHVAWSITHTSADYQDLYLEAFEPQTGARYRTPEGWRDAERSVETIRVARAKPPAAGRRVAGAGGAENASADGYDDGYDEVTIELWRTRHGPIVHGDPRSGVAISLRYTATDTPNRGFECLRPALLARSVAELHEAMREWVDPVNNLVSADTQGNIGYLTRGYLPIRSSQAHRQFPAPGWSGEHEWTGRVPFEALPQAINPAEGFIATANQAVIPGDEPYIAHDFSPPSRAERIIALIAGEGRDARRHTPDEIAGWQADVVSRPARAWSAFLGRVGPYEGDAERARAPLAAFDGNLLPESGTALLYGYFRRSVAQALFEPITGRAVWAGLVGADETTSHSMISRWLSHVVATLGTATGTSATPGGRTWDQTLPAALAAAWQKALTHGGDDPAGWRWGTRHGTRARHPLSGRWPEHAAAWDPPTVPMGGDGDTIQAASYLWKDVPAFDVVGLSVYRQVVDLARIDRASYVIPGGVSGVPGSPHYQDQLPLWQAHRRVPMHFTPDDVRAAAQQTLTLRPA